MRVAARVCLRNVERFSRRTCDAKSNPSRLNSNSYERMRSHIFFSLRRTRNTCDAGNDFVNGSVFGGRAIISYGISSSGLGATGAFANNC